MATPWACNERSVAAVCGYGIHSPAGVHARVDRLAETAPPTRRPCRTAPAIAVSTPVVEVARMEQARRASSPPSRSGRRSRPDRPRRSATPSAAAHSPIVSASGAWANNVLPKSNNTPRTFHGASVRSVELACPDHDPRLAHQSHHDVRRADGAWHSCSAHRRSSTRLFDPDEAAIGVQAMVVRAGGTLYTDIFDRKPPLPPLLYAASFSLTDSTDIRLMRVLVTRAAGGVPGSSWRWSACADGARATPGGAGC